MKAFCWRSAVFVYLVSELAAFRHMTIPLADLKRLVIKLGLCEYPLISVLEICYKFRKFS
jgi:hypothetical protein